MMERKHPHGHDKIYHFRGANGRRDVREHRLQGWWTALKTLMFVLGVLYFVRASIVESFFVPSSSMNPTLHAEDYVLAPKLFYGLRLPFIEDTVISWRGPKRGDIVIFRRNDDPTTEENEAAEFIVKRVIGLPSEQIQIAGTTVYVNKTPLQEPYAVWDPANPSEEARSFTVPEGGILVLGDNRSNSKDSRFWSNPFISINKIVGKPLFVYWSSSSLKRVGVFVY